MSDTSASLSGRNSFRSGSTDIYESNWHPIRFDYTESKFVSADEAKRRLLLSINVAKCDDILDLFLMEIWKYGVRVKSVEFCGTVT